VSKTSRATTHACEEAAGKETHPQLCSGGRSVAGGLRCCSCRLPGCLLGLLLQHAHASSQFLATNYRTRRQRLAKDRTCVKKPKRPASNSRQDGPRSTPGPCAPGGVPLRAAPLQRAAGLPGAAGARGPPPPAGKSLRRPSRFFSQDCTVSHPRHRVWSASMPMTAFAAITAETLKGWRPLATSESWLPDNYYKL
jgi:hypothetical protein